ncbi:MAG: GDP-mannose 4,6-dehydratase [Acidobacteriaceae bacterium]|nr:GDP-mannose 4,6-dehydratase [Acidobacteriaceae bacterium]
MAHRQYACCPPARKVLITGGAGFIGSHLADKLLAQNWSVTALDNFDLFYPKEIKRQNIRHRIGHPNYRFIGGDIRETALLNALGTERWDAVVHLAARAGVRPSIADPRGYYDVNVRGTRNVLEMARSAGVKQFVFASSSSVYGVNPNAPWTEADTGLLPISPYASTKLAGEFLGHVYSERYGIRFLALRFFTVYGTRQRPDLAIYKFARALLAGRPIPLFGGGSTRRDYTHISDIVNGIAAALDYDAGPFEIFNLGSGRPVELRELIRKLEAITGRQAQIEHLPEQPGDVPQTWADIRKAADLLKYAPQIGLNQGLADFVSWVREVPPCANSFPRETRHLQSHCPPARTLLRASYI